MAFSPVIEDSFLDLETVKQVTSLSKTTIYSLIAEGKFPQPVKITGTRRSAWRASELNLWITSQGGVQ